MSNTGPDEHPRFSLTRVSLSNEKERQNRCEHVFHPCECICECSDVDCGSSMCDRVPSIPHHCTLSANHGPKQHSFITFPNDPWDSALPKPWEPLTMSSVSCIALLLSFRFPFGLQGVCLLTYVCTSERILVLKRVAPHYNK